MVSSLALCCLVFFWKVTLGYVIIIYCLQILQITGISNNEMRIPIDNIISNLAMPNLRDVEGATQALVRIQFAYRSEISKYTNMRYADILVFRLDPLHMAQGHIHGVDTQARLTSRQMMNIAQSR